MALAHARHSAMETHSPRMLSPSLRRIRKSLTDKLERFCSSPNSQTTRSSSVSSHAYDENELRFSLDVPTVECARADLNRLGRIETVRVEHSIRKHDHRYYVVHVYLKSMRTPIYRRDPNYSIDKPYPAFFVLRDSVIQSCEQHTTYCESCAARVAVLREHSESPHDLRRLLRTPQEKEKRLEKFVHCLLGVGVGSIQTNGFDDELCDGCTASAHTLVAFLKRQYDPSTGII